MENGNQKWLEELVSSYKKTKPVLNRKPKSLLSEEQRKRINESQK